LVGVVVFGCQVGEDAADGVVGGAGKTYQGGAAWCGAAVLVGGVDGMADLGFQVGWWGGGIAGGGGGHWVSPWWCVGERVVPGLVALAVVAVGLGWWRGHQVG
jgi:hypothetical protein